MTIETINKPNDSKEQVRSFLRTYQDRLTTELASFDAKGHFIEDQWTRTHLGAGRTRVMTDGDFLEQAGIGFSEITGEQVPASLLGQRPDLKGHAYWGAGVSMVLHPHSPHCPTVHLNYRYFEAGPVWWFAGGCDLTPYYAYHEDCVHWHQVLKHAMDQHDPNYHPAFKYWCDEYFYNHHREESRGIGGTFYDYQDGAHGVLVKADHARQSADKLHCALNLKQERKTWEQVFSFQRANAQTFFDAYLPIVQKRRPLAWSAAQREFQLYRRGRYVEFNLLHDRGTLFGLQSKGRTESILMSLPPMVRWQYNFKPAAGSKEEELTSVYLKRGIDWHTQGVSQNKLKTLLTTPENCDVAN